MSALVDRVVERVAAIQGMQKQASVVIVYPLSGIRKEAAKPGFWKGFGEGFHGSNFHTQNQLNALKYGDWKPGAVDDKGKKIDPPDQGGWQTVLPFLGENTLHTLGRITGRLSNPLSLAGLNSIG